MLANTKTVIHYTADGTQTVFSYDFLIFAASHLKVYFDGQPVTFGFTVAPAGIGNPNGGDVTFASAPDTGVTVTLRREVPLTQLLQYVTGDKFPAESHERGLDLAMMAANQLQEELSRTLRFPVGEISGEGAVLPAPIPSVPIGWNSEGTGLANLVEITGLIAITALAHTLLGQSTPGEMRQVLHSDLDPGEIVIGASGGGVELLDLFAWLADMPMNLELEKNTPRIRFRGTHTNGEEYSIVQTSAAFELQRNTGTKATPTWETILQLNAAGSVNVLRNFESVRGTGTPEIGARATHNNSTAAVLARGKTSGGVEVNGRIQSEAGGSVQIGSWSPHEVLLAVNGGTIARFVPDGRILQWPHGYRSGEQSITNGSVITLSHGMPDRPSYVTVELVCVANSQGHSTGDRLVLAASDRFADAVHHGVQVKWNATQIQVLIASNGVGILHGSSYTTTGITNGNWRIVVTAWP